MPLGRYYGAFAGNIPLQAGDFLLESSQDNITATAGGGQANAFQINAQTVRVTTVATTNDSVMLPPSQAGLEMLVINHGVNPMIVYGFASDVIDDTTVGQGVQQMQNSFVLYSCATPGNWYTEGLATGFQRGTSLQTFSSSNIAANATNTQASGTPVVTMLANVTAGAAGSVTLPVSAPGLEITIHNVSAFTVNVFPNAGGTGTEKINALGNNAALALPTNTSTQFTCTTAGQWFTVPRVPS